MKRHVVGGLVCLVVLCSIAVSFPLFVVSSDVPVTATTPIKRAAIVYGFNWNSQATSYVASNYDLLIVDFNGSRSDFYIPYGYWMSDLKFKRDSVQIFGYKDIQYMASFYDDWSEVTTHEDWFVHDDEGNRIVNPRWSTYLMDVGNSGWRQHWISYVNQKLKDCPAYDGVFADDVSDTLYPESFSPVPNSVTVARWHSDTLGMLEYAKANLAQGKNLIINTEAGWINGHVNSDYLEVADGMLIEGYYHAPWEDSNSYTKVLESQLAFLESGTSSGKIMIAGSGSAAEDSRILKWTYSTFLLGLNGANAYWSWNIGSSCTFDPEYLSITATNLGSPVGSYYFNQDVYRRDFTGGTVVTNPTRHPKNISLGESFWLLNNTLVSNFTLSGYSGEILLNQPVPTPTSTPTPPPSPTPTPSFPTLTIFPTLPPLTSTPTPSSKPSPTPTRNPTPSPTPQPTKSPTPTSTISPFASQTPTVSPPNRTVLPSATPTQTASPSSSPTSKDGNSLVPTVFFYVAATVAIAVVVCAIVVRKDFRQALVKRVPFLHRKNE